MDRVQLWSIFDYSVGKKAILLENGTILKIISESDLNHTYVLCMYIVLPHCSKLVVQTNLPSIGKTLIFETGMKSTFTWTMSYKSISVLIIT